MSEPKQTLEEALFEQAAQKPTAAERAAFLDGACRDQPALRARLDMLLEGHFAGAGFLTRTPERDALPATLVAPHPEAVPTQMIGRYKLLEKIGEGGFGDVWMAEQREPVKRRVALKLIKPGMDSRQIVARFEAERQALAMMDHPNIAKIFDAGTTGERQKEENSSSLSSALCPLPSDFPPGRPYFVMELVRGIKITEYCDQNQLTTQQRLDLFIKVCNAIQHAHQKGIIHRDIKPSNILVTLHDGVPVPKVIDFGIAKATQQELTDKTVFTQFQQFIGTPAYISPEQAEMSGLDIDTRADIYSLGVLLYELLVGQTPFDAKEMLKGGLDAMRKIIREREAPRPSTRLSQTLVAAEVTRRKGGGDGESASSRRRLQEVVHQLQGDLDWIVMKCLEKDRARRYDSATGLAADLQRHLANEPVLARPPSAAYQLQKAWRRNRLAFAAAAAVAAALLVGISISTWQAVRATRAKSAETHQRQLAETAQAKETAAKLEALAGQQEAETQRKLAQESDARTGELLYAANLNLLQSAFEGLNTMRARQLLAETRAHTHRGFEWYHWQRELHRETRVLRGHVGPVKAVAFSPDSRRLATAGGDGVIIIRDVASGEETLRLAGDDDPLDRVEFSPDGRRILSNKFLKEGLRIHDATTGRELLKLNRDSGGSFSPDGTKLATGRGERVVVRNSVTGQELLRFQAGDHFRGLGGVSFSADGRSLLVAADYNREKTVATLWDAATGERRLTLTQEQQSSLNNVGAISPDGRRIVTLGFNGPDPLIWEVARPERPLGSLKGHPGDKWRVVFSPDGRQLLTCGDDQTARLWDAETFKELGRFQGHEGRIWDAVFSPDGRWIATASEDGTARLWALDALAGSVKLHPPEHRNVTPPGVYSPDGRWIATVWRGTNSGVTIWDAATAKPLRSVGVVTPVPAKGVRGLMLGSVEALGFSPDGDRLVVTGGGGTAVILDPETGQTLRALPHPDARRVTSATFSPDGKRIATACESGPGDISAPQSVEYSVRIWDADSGQRLHTLPYPKVTARWFQISAVRFTPDGRRLFAASGTEITVWDALTGQVAQSVPLRTAAQSVPLDGSGFLREPAVAVSPDGRSMALSLADSSGVIQILDGVGGPLRHTLLGHRSAVLALQFSADGSRLLSASADQTAKLWDFRSGRELWTLKGHTGPVASVAFSPDGRKTLTCGYDGTARVWEIATPRQVAAWEAEEQTAAAQGALLEAEAKQRRAAAEEARRARREAVAQATAAKLALSGDPARFAQDPGAIRQWLVLSFFAYGDKDERSNLDEEHVAEEARLRPRAGEHTLLFGDIDLTWSPVRLPDHRLDFRALADGRGFSFNVAYAVTYLFSEQARTGLSVKVGSDLHSKLYLNQREIHRSFDAPSAEPDRDTVTGIDLKAGLNVLVFKVAKIQPYDRSVPFTGSVRFTTADGGPVPGLTVTLDPDGKP